MLVYPGFHQLLLEWIEPVGHDIADFFEMVREIILFERRETFLISLLGRRADNRMPELIELGPFLSLSEGWFAVRENCLVGMPDTEKRSGGGKADGDRIDACETTVCQNNGRKRNATFFVPGL